MAARCPSSDRWFRPGRCRRGRGCRRSSRRRERRTRAAGPTVAWRAAGARCAGRCHDVAGCGPAGVSRREHDVAQRSSPGEGEPPFERAGANDGEVGNHHLTLRCPMRCRCIRGRGGVAPRQRVPGSVGRGSYVPYPGAFRARHCFRGAARRPENTSRRSTSRALPPARTRAEHDPGTRRRRRVPGGACPGWSADAAISARGSVVARSRPTRAADATVLAARSTVVAGANARFYPAPQGLLIAMERAGSSVVAEARLDCGRCLRSQRICA